MFCQNIRFFLILSFLALALAPESAPADDNGNVKSVSSGSYTDFFGGGNPATAGTALNNSVTMTGGTISNDLLGGASSNGNTNENTVSLEGGSIGQNLYGGYTVSGQASGNIVNVSGGTVGRDVVGGYTENGQASGNTVNVSGNALITRIVTGGFSGSGAADGNSVHVTGGTVNDTVYGAWSRTGSASNNEVIMSAGQTGDLGGAYGATSATTDNNTVTFNGGTAANVFGANNSGGSASTNRVIVNAGGITGNALGATGNTRLTGNGVILNQGRVNGDVIGARLYSPGGGVATGNFAEINADVGGNVYGGQILAGLQGTLENNTVIIRSGTVTQSVYGGSAARGSAQGNSVSALGGSIGADVYGGYSQDGTANGNSVLINGAQVSGSVMGGQSLTGSAGNNTVNVLSGNIGADVYGGFSTGGSVNNTVNLQGGSIQGGVYGSNTDLSGNTLNVQGFSGTVREVNNFERYTFLVPSHVGPGGTVIAVTGPNPTRMDGASVTDLRFAPSAITYRPGDKVNLIGSASGSVPATTFRNVAHGISRLYDMDVLVDSGALVARIAAAGVNPQTDNLGNGRLGAQTDLNRGADLVSGSGLDKAWRAAEDCNGQSRLAAFSDFSYGKTNQSDHFDTQGGSLIAGLAWRDNRDCGRGFLGGLFFEAGKGYYDGSDSNAGLGDFNYHGDSGYYGGGLMARYRFDNNLRLEAAFRGGRVDTDFHGSGHASGQNPEYDLNSWYYGTYAGAGWDHDLTDALNLDLTVKYFWTRQTEKTVAVAGEDIHFDALDSHRIRTGPRLSLGLGEAAIAYLGVYYEHEFDGRAKFHNQTADISHKSIKVEGDTGVGELGFSLALAQDLLMDLSVQGSVGERKGVIGNLALTWQF